MWYHYTVYTCSARFVPVFDGKKNISFAKITYYIASYLIMYPIPSHYKHYQKEEKTQFTSISVAFHFFGGSNYVYIYIYVYIVCRSTYSSIYHHIYILIYPHFCSQIPPYNPRIMTLVYPNISPLFLLKFLAKSLHFPSKDIILSEYIIVIPLFPFIISHSMVIHSHFCSH